MPGRGRSEHDIPFARRGGPGALPADQGAPSCAPRTLPAGRRHRKRSTRVHRVGDTRAMHRLAFVLFVLLAAAPAARAGTFQPPPGKVYTGFSGGVSTQPYSG